MTARCEKNPFVFLEIAIDGKKVGTLTFELRRDVAPKTVENFLLLCTGDSIDKLNPKNLCYKGSIVHRIVPGQVLQAGDIENGDGTGGESIYGNHFEDENFSLKHVGRGVLSMMNTRPNANHSQFFVTFDKMTMLDSRHVVFGYLCAGAAVLRMIENVGSKCGRPRKTVSIVGSGERS